MTPEEPRRCARCGAPLAPEQDWCLECGNAVTTRVIGPPRWRLPLVVGLAVLALLGIGVAVAVSSMSSDADRAAAGPGTTTATPTARSHPVTVRPATATTRAPTATATTPRATPTIATVPRAAEGKAPGPVPQWPAKTSAYTVVIPTAGGRKEAERQARKLIASGRPAGVLKTDGFDFFAPGSWVVWVGRYPDRPTAERHLGKASDGASGAYVTLVRPRGGG